MWGIENVNLAKSSSRKREIVNSEMETRNCKCKFGIQKQKLRNCKFRITVCSSYAGLVIMTLQK